MEWKDRKELHPSTSPRQGQQKLSCRGWSLAHRKHQSLDLRLNLGLNF